MQYIKECLQLLWWICFKPYTLRQHLSDIWLDLNLHTNRYKKVADIVIIWWVLALIPIVAVCLTLPLSKIISCFFSIEQVAFLDILSFIFGWLAGLLIVYEVFKKDYILLILMIAGCFFMKVYIENLLYPSILFGFMFGATVGMEFNFAFSVAFGLAIGVAFGLAFGLIVGFKIGLIVALAVGVFLNFIIFLEIGATSIGVVDTTVWLTSIFNILLIYFWLPESLWILLLRIFPGKRAPRLHFLPPYFDQRIILSLPFLPTFIAEAYRENRTAARCTIDYLITSTNQQKAARKAISLIAAEECRHCRTTGEIAALREQLSWLSEEPSPGLAACLEISQDVTAALEASSPYRKAQQMDKVIQRIEQQRNALAAASAREATSFGSVLDNWQGILKTARKTLQEQAARSNEIPQVYLAGPALDPNKAGPLFKGRRDLFRQIETLTLSAQHPTLVMHGGRRSGKTSTLNYLPKWLPSDILPLLIDGQSLATTSTLAGFAEEFADLITKSARKIHSLQLPAVDSVPRSDDPFVRLRRWLDAVEQAVPDKTLLLCLDEFERLDEIVRSTDSRAPLNFL
ncbi:MAG: hypothetical protein D3906_06385, partial [Candidatus Electrothrix sp. AUS1_2]|nr:hypothetical protein [Candidatus Electrothrix sp. AUS1_2]